MGLFNHLFGGKEGVAKELFDKERRLMLLEQHLSDYPLRENMSRAFSPGNVDKALSDWDGLDTVLNQIASSISKDLIEIDEEERDEAVIMADMKLLTQVPQSQDPVKWKSELVEVLDKQKVLFQIFRRIHDVLKLELEAIRRIRQRSPNSREMLLYLFRLIFNQEAILYMSLKEEYFIDREVYVMVNRVVRAVLLEEEMLKELPPDKRRLLKQEKKSGSVRQPASPVEYAQYMQRKNIEWVRRLGHIVRELTVVLYKKFPVDAPNFEFVFEQSGDVWSSSDPPFGIFLVPKGNPSRRYTIMRLFSQDLNAKVTLSGMSVYYQIPAFWENIEKGIQQFKGG